MSQSGGLFSHRPFALFWVARVLTASGFQIQSVAVAWQVYELTASALDLGVVGLVQFLPRLVLLPVAGDLADRLDRRRLVAASQAVQALGMAILAGLTWTGVVSRESIFILLAVMGAARTFEMPTSQALLPALVPETALARAVAMGASAMQAATIAAPALAGVLYVLGAGTVHGLAAVVFVLATGLTTCIRPLRPQPPFVGTTSGWARFREGLGFVRHHRPVLGAISLDMMAVLLGGATALLPIVAAEVLHTGPWGLGLLRSAPAVGALAMSLWLARHPLGRRVGHRMFQAVAIFGLATIGFGLSRSVWLSAALLVVLGAADMISLVFRQAYIQLETPDAMRGRVSAVNALFIGASNQLGEFESGVTAAWLGLVPAIVLGGVGTLVVAALWWRWFPELGRVDRLGD
ncbi:MAG: MFS transporter [Zoogloeaceae bacterium]|nr:MFS transporter [Zoogloeaceae bacterium]